MKSLWFVLLFGALITYNGFGFTTVSGEVVPESQPSYTQCKPYVDAALKGEVPSAPQLPVTSAEDAPPPEGGAPSSGSEESAEDSNATQETPVTPVEAQAQTTEQAAPQGDANESDGSSEEQSDVAPAQEDDESKEAGEAGVEENSAEDSKEDATKESNEATTTTTTEAGEATQENTGENEADSKEESGEESTEENPATTDATPTSGDEDSKEDTSASAEEVATPSSSADTSAQTPEVADEKSNEQKDVEADTNSQEAQPEGSQAATGSDGDSGEDSKEETQSDAADRDNVADQADQSESDESQEVQQEVTEGQATAETATTTEAELPVSAPATPETPAAPVATEQQEAAKEPVVEAVPEPAQAAPAQTEAASAEAKTDDSASAEDNSQEATGSEEDDSSESDEDEAEAYTPRSRDHLIQILGLDGSEKSQTLYQLLDKATHTTLKELKSIYEQAIKPLETLYKYRDLSNRHFGDPEIFSKPMVVFMGPWSGGKSTILNWLLGIENQDSALRTGADPSPAQFNIMTHGSEDEVLDGTQLAADWTFSGLQKFGQAFLDRLRGRKLPNRLLEKVNLVEIPGILEVRKQVERSFPFNDACQWFIDRADVLFLVYDPAKLDIGPETEAILDQLKGRENQVRIVLNKADSVKPDELLRLQANLIWNISPLMASAEPPTLYVASLWGRPLNPESPTSLLVSHENNFLKDIRDATEKRVETRIAAARRFAVRVRNHGKMCDCYLNTYNNHRSFFSNKKKISDDIIEHPQNYHIYEGLSTLTNISRYDLPDPDTYRDFFRLNPLWEFPTLASTCTYFRGCPINKLDIAIAYDLPELLGRFRRQRESIIAVQNQKQTNQNQNQPSKSSKPK